MFAFFNELSLPVFESGAKAGIFFESLGEMCKTAKELGIKQIKILSSFNAHEFASEYLFYHWISDRRTDGDLRTLLIDVLTTTPYIDDILVQYERDNGKAMEMLFKGKQCFGLGLASNLVFDTAGISYSSGENWTEEVYEIALVLLEEDEKGKLETSEVSGTVRNIATSIHFGVHKPHFQAALKKELETGRLLWERRGEVFSHLDFCEKVRGQLEGLNSSAAEFSQIVKRLFELQDFAKKWDRSSIKTSDFATKVSPESKNRLDTFRNELTILCPDTAYRLFDWHARYTPGAGRIYFFPDGSRGKFIIGSIALKLT